MQQGRNLIKNNLFFLLVILGLLVCFLNRWQSLDTVVAPEDTEVWFDVHDRMVTQTWSPDAKWIESISIPYLPDGDFKGNISVSFINHLTGETLLSREVSLDCRDGEKGEIAVDFHHLALDLTTQYLFQLQYEEVSEGSGLYLYGCEKYAGGAMNGEDLRTGISVGISFVKYNSLFFFCLMLFILYSFSVFYMLLWNRRFEETVGLSVLSIGFVLYVFGLNNRLEWGVYFVGFLAAVMFAGIIYLYNKRKMTFSQLYCPTMVIFAVMFAVFMAYNRGIWYTRSDEYSHWGKAVKDMYYFNAMSNHPNSTVTAYDYPPFSTLLEYFFTYWNGLFSEPATYVGYQTAMTSLLAVCWKTDKKKNIYTLPLMVSTILVPVMFINDSYCTIYADALVGAILTYLLVCWIQEGITGFNAFRISLGLFALTLTKRGGLYFTLLFIGILVLDQLISKKKIFQSLLIPLLLETALLAHISFNRYAEGESLLSIGTFLVLQAAFLVYWGRTKGKHVRNKFVKKSFLGMQSFIKKTWRAGLIFLAILLAVVFLIFSPQVITICRTMYAKVFYAECDRQQILLWLTCLKELWTEGIWTLGGCNVSYMGVVMVLQMICILVHLALKHQGYHTGILKNSILLTLGAMGYAAVVLASRISLHNMFSNTVIDSHERYLGSYGIALIMIAVVLLVRALEQKNENMPAGSVRTAGRVNYAISFLICFVIVACTPLSFFITKNDGRGYNTEYMSPFGNIEKMTQSTAKIGDRVFYITNNGLGANKLIFSQTVSPWLTVSRIEFNGLCASDTIYSEYPGKRPRSASGASVLYMTEEQLSEVLRDYQYVFIMRSEDYFVASYSSLFEDPDSIENGSFYQVKYTEDGRLYLELIGKVGVLIC